MVGETGQASPRACPGLAGQSLEPGDRPGTCGPSQLPLYRPGGELPCISPEFNNPHGVPISAIIFGGRRAKTAPLVYQSRNWQHGVFVGSIMASEKTAAAEGTVGETRRDPMAMLPFCGYHMADYWQHWLDMERDIAHPPKIFNVNWFRTDEKGEFIWPGFGENMRVVEWILKRCFDEVGARETEIGYLPNPEDINLEGIDVSSPLFFRGKSFPPVFGRIMGLPVRRKRLSPSAHRISTGFSTACGKVLSTVRNCSRRFIKRSFCLRTGVPPPNSGGNAVNPVELAGEAGQRVVSRPVSGLRHRTGGGHQPYGGVMDAELVQIILGRQPQSFPEPAAQGNLAEMTQGRQLRHPDVLCEMRG